MNCTKNKKTKTKKITTHSNKLKSENCLKLINNQGANRLRDVRVAIKIEFINDGGGGKRGRERERTKFIHTLFKLLCT